MTFNLQRTIKKGLKIIIVLLFITAAVVSAVYFFLESRGQDLNSVSIKERIKEIEEELFSSSKDVEDIKQTAWIPYWDFDRGYESLVKNKDKFESVSPVWYELNKDGSVRALKRPSHSKLLTFARSSDVLLIPSIASFDAEALRAALSEENYDNHLAYILGEVDEHGYDGIDIDYEQAFREDKKLFMGFLKDLSFEMKKRDKILTVAVLSKWGDHVIYPSSPQTRSVQDWEEMSKYADEIRIMTYDYTSTVSKHPGPIAPLIWMNDVLEYAVTKIPREKIMLGVHLYAYEWVSKEYDPNINIDNNPLEKKIQVNAHEYSDILDIKKNYEVEEFPEDAYGEMILQYSKNDATRIVFYINGSGVRARKELAARHGIKGVAYWRLGGEDDSGF